MKMKYSTPLLTEEGLFEKDVMASSWENPDEPVINRTENAIEDFANFI